MKEIGASDVLGWGEGMQTSAVIGTTLVLQMVFSL